MRIAYWIPKTINTHSEYVILVLQGNDDCTNAPQCSNILYCLSCSFQYELSEIWPQMYIGLNVKYLYSCHILMKVEFSWQIFEKNSNFMTVRPVGAKLHYAGGRTDRHEDANSSFSQFCKRAKNVVKRTTDDNITWRMRFHAEYLEVKTHSE